MALILRSEQDGCATLTLNRPEKRNALNIATFAELAEQISDLAKRNDTIGLVVLQGAGPCFSAGFDLSEIGSKAEPPEPNFQGRVIETLADLPQPLLVVVHGHCYTGALELALAGDLIVAAQSASFADTHAKWALTPAWGMSQRLPRRIGLAKAREMMITCRSYSGDEAAAFGLVNASFADDRLADEVAALKRDILANSGFTHQAYKALLRETDGMPLAAGLSHEFYRRRGRGPDALRRVRDFK